MAERSCRPAFLPFYRLAVVEIPPYAFFRNGIYGSCYFKKLLENDFNWGYDLFGHRCTLQIGETVLKFYISVTPERIPPSTVIYMRRTGEYGVENYKLMDTFKKWIKENHLYDEDTVIYAIPMDNPEKAESYRRRYDVCRNQPQDWKFTQNQIKRRELEGGNYLTFLIPHTADTVQTAWKTCFSELDKLGYLPDESRPVMERYKKSLVENHYCEWCMPILSF